jgi:hypothetical protein
MAMTPATEVQVRNIRRFGHYARQFCVLIGTVLGLAVPLVLWSVFAGPRIKTLKINFGAFFVSGDQLTSPQLKAWSAIVIFTSFTIVLWGVYHLHRLFSHLEAGEIYSQRNVRHIRQVGLLAMAMAVLQLLLPALTFVLVEVGFIDRTLIDGGGLVIGTGSFSGFAMAALVLLASWIMDVGRETSDEAAEMRRDADLVI